MPTIVSLAIEGGWATDLGPSAPPQFKGQGPSGELILSVPWLVDAENCVYELDGWPRKMPGASNVNGTATGASDHVMGIFDYWRAQTSGSPSQQRLLYSGTAMYRESGGALTAIKTGLEAAKMPWFEVMNDECVIATTSTVDVPMVYDQTTFANLGGSPPNFAFCVEHRGRMWAAGVDSAKYRLYYSASANHEDWTGAGSGSIDFPYQISGLRSHKGELIVFMGPSSLAIDRLTGSAPTGADAFARVPFVRGIGSANHQSIILGPQDLWFWDDLGIHSLNATANYGDYTSDFLSAPIGTYFTDQLNHNRFDQIWGVNFVTAGYALWTVSRAGVSTHDAILMLDYRFRPLRFALWPAYAVASLAMVRDASRLTVPWAGTYTGRALRMNRPSRNLAASAYTYRTRTPYLPFGDAFMDKTLTNGRIGIAPKGATSATIGWQRDGKTQQTTTVDQSGTALLGDSSDNFALDTDVLAGGRYVPKFFEMSGSFKELQLELTKGGTDEDFEPHGLALIFDDAGLGLVEPIG